MKKAFTYKKKYKKITLILKIYFLIIFLIFVLVKNYFVIIIFPQISELNQKENYIKLELINHLIKIKRELEKKLYPLLFKKLKNNC